MFGKKLKKYDLSSEELSKLKWARVETSKGVIWLEMFANEAPNTVANFAHLANSGFYDNLNFHRVIAGFMAQGGCPLGTGTGSPEWAIECECDNNTSAHERGAISMAHAGRNTGGSQFFICFVKCDHLDGVHTVFGSIAKDDTASFEVLDSIRMRDDIVSIKVLPERE
ncbi:MAG: peptidylprolyl isomerase [Sulfuricurvum sp.]